MAPTPVDNTARLWIKKSGISGEHETMFRFNVEATPTTAVAAVEPFLNAVAPLMWAGDSFVSARWAALGDNLSFPVAFDPIPGENPGTPDEAQYPGFLSFVARGTDGKQVRWTFNGMPFTPDDNYRIFGSENADVQDAIDALGFAVDVVDIGGAPKFMYPYVNLGYNAYFQRQARK